MSNSEAKPALDPAFLTSARDAYAIYQAASGGLNYQGLPCPALDDVPEQILVNWYTTALRFREHEVLGTRPGDEAQNPPRPHVFAHLPDPARALEIWQRYMGVAAPGTPPSPAAALADEMRRGVARFVSAEQLAAAASSATAPTAAAGSAEPPTEPTEPAPEGRWVPVLTIGGETTPAQRQRNFALYKRLRDGDGTGRFRTSGLSGFVFDVPHERMRVAPDGSSFSFRLEKNDECLRRLLSVISDHFDSRCDADDEVERLRARVAELEARQGGA